MSHVNRGVLQARRRGDFGWVAVLLLLGVAGCVHRGSHLAPQAFRVMTYNIHHGEGMDGQVDLERIAELIRSEDADVVALQEVDRGVARTDGRDLAAELSVLTGMTSVFSNNVHYQGGEYGNALLSRRPIGDWRNTHYRMLRGGEQRGLLHVEIDVGGRRLMILTTHLDYRPDDAERLSNVQEILSAMEAYAGIPVVVCGDFNAVPGSPTHEAMKGRFADVWEQVGTGQGFTFPSAEPARRIDYIFLEGGGRVTAVKAWVPLSLASDHLPLVVEFQWE